MKKNVLVILTVILCVISTTSYAEDDSMMSYAAGMPTIIWNTPAPAPPEPEPDPIIDTEELEPITMSNLTSAAPAWKEIDWASNNTEQYFLILADANFDNESIKTLMLWLSDTYMIPSMANRMDQSEIDQRIRQLVDRETKIAALLLYGYDRTALSETINYCTEHGMPIWVSQQIEYSPMTEEIESLFSGVYNQVALDNSK